MTIPELRVLRAGILWLPRAVAMLLLLGLGFGLTCPLPVLGSESDRKPEKPYALIYGTVFDSAGHTVYGVRVKIRRAADKKARWELYSDHSGEFAQRVPAGPGEYVIWADLKGYKALNGNKLQVGSEVTVHIENDERANVTVHLK